MNDFTILVSEAPFTGNAGGTAFVSKPEQPQANQTQTAAVDDYYAEAFFNVNGLPYEGSEVQKYNQLKPSLYTVKRSDYQRIQSSFKKDLYIQSQGNTAIESVKPNLGEEGLWKVIPAHDGWVRIQNLKLVQSNATGPVPCGS